MALRKVTKPVRPSRRATLGLAKMFMENSLKTDPEWGLMLHCDIRVLEGPFK
jgi:hypothetical protein